MSSTRSITRSSLDFIRNLIYSLSRFTATAVTLRDMQLGELRARRQNNDPRRLSIHEHQVFSQNGEDGTIREIFRRIGVDDRFFVEIGVGNGLENNTAFLLRDDWSGVWVEGSAANCRFIRKHFAEEIRSKRLVLVEGFVTAGNILDLLNPVAGHRNIDLISVDVDRNTYYVWEALMSLRARVAVIEYNAMYPADMLWIADYNSGKWWNGTSHFGASLASLADLGERMNQKLVGCDVTGTNAFFVRGDLVEDRFCEPFSSENHYEPIRYHLQPVKSGHPRAFRD